MEKPGRQCPREGNASLLIDSAHAAITETNQHCPIGHARLSQGQCSPPISATNCVRAFLTSYTVELTLPSLSRYMPCALCKAIDCDRYYAVKYLKSDVRRFLPEKGLEPLGQPAMINLFSQVSQTRTLWIVSGVVRWMFLQKFETKRGSTPPLSCPGQRLYPRMLNDVIDDLAQFGRSRPRNIP